MIDSNEKERYSRQMGMVFWGEKAQIKLRESKIFVAGAGGLGSAVLYYCAAAGIGTINICDYDIVDLTNLNRQVIHNINSIGTLKTESASTRLKELNDRITVNLLPERIESDSVFECISKSDLIIDCLDSFQSRLTLNEYAIDAGIPLVHAGISEFYGQITFIQAKETPCLNCFMPHKDTPGPIQVTGAVAGVMGSLQCLEAIKYLAGFGENLKNKLLFWDGLSMKFEKIALIKNPHCSVCGRL